VPAVLSDQHALRFSYESVPCLAQGCALEALVASAYALTGTRNETVLAVLAERALEPGVLPHISGAALKALNKALRPKQLPKPPLPWSLPGRELPKEEGFCGSDI
jgi:hypothetical protein